MMGISTGGGGFSGSSGVGGSDSNEQGTGNTRTYVKNVYETNSKGLNGVIVPVVAVCILLLIFKVSKRRGR